MNLYTNLSKRLSENIARNTILCTLLFALAGTCLVCMYHKPWNLKTSDASFGYGALYKSMVSVGKFQVCNVHFPTCFSTHRLPLIPYFLYFTAKVFGDNLFYAYLVKNLLFGGLTAFLLSVYVKRQSAPPLFIFLLFAFFASFPQLILHSFEVNYEEGYLIPVWAMVCMWLFTPGTKFDNTDAFGFSLANAGLLLIKHSFTYVSPLLPFLLFLKTGNRKHLIIGYIVLIFTWIGLSAFNQHNSGRFTVSSSWAGWNLYKGNCANTLKLYPLYNLDVMDYQPDMLKPELGNVKNEWDYDDFYNEKAYAYIKSDIPAFVQRAFVKGWVLFFEIRPTGLNLGEQRYDSPIKYIGSVYYLTFRLLFCLSVVLAAISLLKKSNKELKMASVTFLILIAAYSFSYLVGFAYERHAMPLTMPVLFYLLYWADNWQRLLLVTEG